MLWGGGGPASRGCSPMGAVRDHASQAPGPETRPSICRSAVPWVRTCQPHERGQRLSRGLMGFKDASNSEGGAPQAVGISKGKHMEDVITYGERGASSSPGRPCGEWAGATSLWENLECQGQGCTWSCEGLCATRGTAGTDEEPSVCRVAGTSLALVS